MDSLLSVEDQLYAQQALSAPWGELGRSWTLGLVALAAKLALTVANRFSVEGLDTLHEHAMRRPQGCGLITVSNHTRCLGPWGLGWAPF